MTLAGCATESASREELSQLKAELRAQRERNERLEDRVKRLEDQNAVLGAHKAQPGKTPLPVKNTMPDLTVVKLKPKAEPAPRIDTRVDVVEPAPDFVAEISTSAATDDKDAPPPDPVVLDARFNDGLESLKTGNVEGGVLKLQTFASEHPQHQKADNALYFAGVGLMGLSDFDGASRTFAQVVDGYPAGDATVDAMLKLAECRVRMNQPDGAKALYSKVLESYPGTPAATQAQARLAALH